MLPLALQLYSVREDMEQDFEGSLRRVKALGYDGVEFAGLFGRAPEEVRALLAEIGLLPVSAHVPYAQMIENPEGALGLYKAIGCPYVAIPYMTEEYRMGGAKEKEALAGIRRLAETARGLGLVMLYHNHDFEFREFGGKYGLDILFESVPAELLQTEIDTCWVGSVGVDVPSYLRKYAGRAPVVHLKDYVMEGGTPTGAYELIDLPTAEKLRSGQFEFRPLGSGRQDLPAILEAVEDAGAKWLVVEQDQPGMGKTAFECARMSIEYLKSLA